MPSLQDKIQHAAKVASWKVDQQMRLTNSQSKLRSVEDQIRQEKMRLAETVIALASQGGLSLEGVQEHLTTIESLTEQLALQSQELELIRNEAAPTLEAPAPPPPAPAAPAYTPPAYTPPAPAAAPAPAKLVCPNCQRELAGKFCPDCGVQGVPAQG